MHWFCLTGLCAFRFLKWIFTNDANASDEDE